MNGFIPVVKLPRFNRIKIKAKVATTSEKKLKNAALIAGRVAKMPTLVPSLTVLVALNCGY